MSQDIWDIVVNQGAEDKYAKSEESDRFTVEYQSKNEFQAALTRFEGAIEYNIVTDNADCQKG